MPKQPEGPTPEQIAVRSRFDRNAANQFQSTAEARKENNFRDMFLDDDQRGDMPLTKEKFIITENPALVEWERETRKFIKNLSRYTSHKITAIMVFEWATGISITQLRIEENTAAKSAKGGGINGSANMHLRLISGLLKQYFGTPYKTRILGQSVDRAYTVPEEFRVDRVRPKCLTLWPEYDNGTLRP